MALSMTGFGRGSASDGGRLASVEIKSVNNRYCDIQVRMPRSLAALEVEVRNRCKSIVSRGKLDVVISYSDTGDSARKVMPNLPLATAYYEALCSIGETLDVPAKVTAKELAGFPDVLMIEDNSVQVEDIQGLIFSALTEALNNLVQMKTTEGKRLTSDIMMGFGHLSVLLEQVRTRAPRVPIEYRERLHHRLNDLLDTTQRHYIDEQRLAAEVLVFADKADIHEEMIRLESHLVSMREIVRKNQPVGKQLDFFCQEVNREINTIGSKANDLELTNLTISMKSYLEKVREQVQNLE